MDRDAIAALIPHSGAMCLLDAVQSWDQQSIVCTVQSRRSENNPLLEQGQLSAVALVEYGAQAAAVHAGLVQHGMSQGGTAFIGAVKDLQLKDTLVDLTLPSLTINAGAY
ncbi:MAG TPA: hypothetical protein ENI05_14775 [Porticoccus sp.]|nr:hypothetical protein [Porticoccus sp.]